MASRLMNVLISASSTFFPLKSFLSKCEEFCGFCMFMFLKRIDYTLSNFYYQRSRKTCLLSLVRLIGGGLGLKYFCKKQK